MSSKIKRREFIKECAKASFFFTLSFHLDGEKNPRAAPLFDLLIINGMVIDGLKDEGYKADIGIIRDKIEAIGNLKNRKARMIIDASGKIVSPGFIDIHSHSDSILLINPKGESKIRQGVTTELGGNCGGSEFPLKKLDSKEEILSNESFPLKRDWTDLEGFLFRLSQKGIAINYGTLIGHGTVRSYVMGEEQRDPSPEELKNMKKIVTQAMEQGAFGLSTGLEYTPSGFASTQELIELCRVVAKFGGFYATHLRSEDTYILEAIGEALHIAAEARLPLQISHLKVCGNDNWWKLPMMLDLMEQAQKRGLMVNADAYPYTAYSTGISVFFPHWALAGGREAFLSRLKNPEEREKMKKETMEKLKGTPWENIVIIDADKEENKKFIGKNVKEAALMENKDPYEFSCDLLGGEGGHVPIIGFGMNEENVEKILKHHLVMLSSDGSALAPYGPLSRGIPHPRNYGAFPKFLRFCVREKKILTLPEAIKKMTSMPAAKMGIKGRGALVKGNYADLVIFDPETIGDKATYTEPGQYPIGIDYVIVNGRIVIDHGQHTGELPGRVLYGPAKK